MTQPFALLTDSWVRLVPLFSTVTVAAGDAGFDHDQLRRRATSAIVHDRKANRRTQQQLCQVLDQGGLVILSHDLQHAPQA